MKLVINVGMFVIFVVILATQTQVAILQMCLQ